MWESSRRQSKATSSSVDANRCRSQRGRLFGGSWSNRLTWPLASINLPGRRGEECARLHWKVSRTDGRLVTRRDAALRSLIKDTLWTAMASRILWLLYRCYGKCCSEHYDPRVNSLHSVPPQTEICDNYKASPRKPPQVLAKTTLNCS